MTPPAAGTPRHDIPDDHVVLGQIGKPHGNGGDVYVFADADLVEAFDVGTSFRKAGAAGGSLVVSRSRRQGDRLIVGFKGSSRRADAEALRGVVVSRPRADVTLDEESVWVADLIGRTVLDDDGAMVGVVEGIEDGYAHDLVVVTLPSGRLARVPMVTELIEWTVDPLVLHPIPGLIDDDAD